MRRILAGLAGLTAIAAIALGQAAPAGQVVGVGNFIHNVANLEKSLQFYHDVIGLDLQGDPPEPGSTRPFVATPQVPKLYNAVGAQYRVASAIVIGSPMRTELVEFKDIDRKPVTPRIQDPGASIYAVTVRSVAATMAMAKKYGVSVVTTGGQPVKLGDNSLAVVLKDPDGFFVEVIERHPSPGTNAAADTNPLDAAFWFTVSDIAAMRALFKDALGFNLVTSPFVADKAQAKLMGLRGVEIRRATALVPGTSFEISFLEFKGVDRMPVHSRPQDPGSAVLRLLVGDLDFTLKTLDDAGAKVVSAGGGPVTLPAGSRNTIRAAITSAPDNLFVQVLAAPSPK